MNKQNQSELRAEIDHSLCLANGDCIKVCQVQAIKEGPKRMSTACGAAELQAGKAIVDADICNGCGDCVAVCSNHAIEMVPVAVQ